MFSEHRVALPVLEAGRAHDPRVDLGAVLRDRGEALRRHELAAVGEVLAESRQLRLADVELAAGSARSCRSGRPRRRGRRTRRGRSAAVHELRLAPVRRDAVDVHVPVVLGREDDRVAFPDRLAEIRVRAALAVERRGQDPPVAAGLPRRRPRSACGAGSRTRRAPVAREQLPVRRVARRVVAAVAGREPLRLAPGGRDDVDVAEQLDVPVVAAGGAERDALSVRGPGGLAVLVVAVGDLLRLGRAVGGHDEEVRAPVAGPADAVELELEPREPPRRALLVVLLLVGLVAYAGGEASCDPSGDQAISPRPSFRSVRQPARRRRPG